MDERSAAAGQEQDRGVNGHWMLLERHLVSLRLSPQIGQESADRHNFVPKRESLIKTYSTIGINSHENIKIKSELQSACM